MLLCKGGCNDFVKAEKYGVMGIQVVAVGPLGRQMKTELGSCELPQRQLYNGVVNLLKTIG